MKKILSLLLLALSAASLQATVLFQDSTNYPYTNGPIAGQGQWYVYSSGTASNDVVVTNDVIYLKSSGYDSVATPTNGFFNSTNPTLTWASFTLNVSKVPASTDGGDYFCQFISTNNNKCCNLFITSAGTAVPGTYRLAIANFSVSFTNLKPPVIFPEDLATNTTYTILIAYDTDENSAYTGATLMIDPSASDYYNFLAGNDDYDTGGTGFVYGDDYGNTAQNNLFLTAIGFQPYINAGFSNVIVGTTFSDVYNTNAIAAPVFGVQPASVTNYSGNPATFYSLAAGADVTYQWYSSTYGALTDGSAYTGSQSNIFTVNSLTASDTYYVVATDANGHSTSSTNAVDTVITTPTAPFFTANETNTTSTNNLFQTTVFTDVAYGTGPLTYQWYFKATNASSTFVPLSGQTSPTISIYLADLTAPGQYYVVASNSVNGGSITYGPTNTLVEIAPLFASLVQLHQFIQADIANLTSGTYYINTNTVIVGGYVSCYQGYGTTYTTFFIEDTNGYGCSVYLGGLGNTNFPPIGTYVTVSGALESYYGELEITPLTPSQIVVSNGAPPISFHPFLGNPSYTNLVQSPYGSNSLRYSESLVTFTNVYIYSSSTGLAVGASGTGAHNGVGGTFYNNGYTTLYATVGAYDATTNNRTLEIFVPGYDYRYTNGGSVTVVPNVFDGKTIPTHCAQLTGVLEPYSSTYNEIIPSRYVDFVTSSPTPVNITYGETNKALSLSWPAIPGVTYSVNATTNATTPFANVTYGLGYYPTNGLYTETVSNGVPLKLFQVTSP